MSTSPYVRAYRQLLIGQTLSAIGSGMGLVVMPAVVLKATGSSGEAGIVMGTGLLVRLCARLPAGVAVDRWNRRRVMILAELCPAVAMLALAAILLAHMSASVVVPGAMGAIITDEVCGALARGAEAATLRQIVELDALGPVMSAFAGRGFVAALIGPTLGGLLVMVGLWLPLAVDAFTYLFSLLAVALLPQIPVSLTRRAPWVVHGRDGIRTVLADPVLRLNAFTGLSINFAFSGTFLLVIASGLRRANEGGTLLAGTALSLAAALGVFGAIVAPWLLSAVTPSRLLCGSFVVLCLTLVVMPMVSGVLYQGLLLGLANAVAPSCAGLLSAYQAKVVPGEHQGVTTAAIGFIGSLGAPAGPLVAGLLASSIGERLAATVLAAGLVIGCWSTTRRAGLRQLDASMRIAVDRGAARVEAPPR